MILRGAGHYTFLAISGIALAAGAKETFALIVDLYRRGSFDFASLVCWLQFHTSQGRMLSASCHESGGAVHLPFRPEPHPGAVARAADEGVRESEDVS